jgi:hypothetical protein
MAGLAWQKSSFSSDDGNYGCVELASSHDDDLRYLRESDEPGILLSTTPTRLAALLRTARRQPL